VIRKGVNLILFNAERDRAALRTELQLPDRNTVLTVAGLVPRKGIDVVLRAVAALKDRFDFTFLIAGDGPARRELEALSRTLAIDTRTKFLGRVSRADVARYFTACDVFVLGSTMEAAGNVILEAMACARPIVCTDSGGPGEYVSDGETGFVVPVGDVTAMADRIGRLLSRPNQAAHMGQAGLARAQKDLSYSRMVDDIRHVYDEALRDSGRVA
jgi:D-inositol-3-phosphate glycosyltransferase